MWRQFCSSGLGRMARDGFLLYSHSLKICQAFVQKPQAGGAERAVGERRENCLVVCDSSNDVHLGSRNPQEAGEGV